VIVDSTDGTVVFRGTATYRAFTFGNCLRIEVESDSSGRNNGLSICIGEDEWQGELVTDSEFGCDFQIRLRL